LTEPKWLTEIGERHRVQYLVDRVVFSGRSRHQSIDIIDTPEYGRMLLLDNVVNSSTRDEHIYHETLIHPAALTHPQPRSALIVGGAEGASVRELFRHPSIERVVMVDIDEELVDLCRRHLPSLHAGVFDDPRLTLFFGDGRRYLAETNERFDLIYIDLSDPVADSPAVYLYTREFYQLVFDRLTEEGACGLQGETIKPWKIELHARMVNTLAEVFPHVAAYPYMLPAFHEPHAQIAVSRGEDPRRADLGGRMAQRGLNLQYLSPDNLANLFFLPAHIQRGYEDHTKILTDDDPYDRWVF
jgi:spermidine synthase